MTTFLIPKENEVTRQELGLPIAPLVKNPPAIQETRVRFWGREDVLEEG